MRDLMRAGGVAALAQSAAYVTGFALFLAVLGSPEAPGAVAAVRFVADNRAALLAGTVAVYVATGMALVPLAVAVHEHLAPRSPAIMRTATALGLIWAGLLLASGMIAIVGMDAVVGMIDADMERAATVWMGIAIVQDALGGGIEIVGGAWVLLVGWAAARTRRLPRAMAWAGVLIGGTGFLTVVPALGDLADLFGLALIIWFAWLGVVLLRARPVDA